MKKDPKLSRMRIAFPDPLYNALNELIPANEHNQFIVDVLNRELNRVRLMKVIEETCGVWTIENHPDLATPEDMDAYVRRMRESWMPRTWDGLAAEDENGNY